MPGLGRSHPAGVGGQRAIQTNLRMALPPLLHQGDQPVEFLLSEPAGFTGMGIETCDDKVGVAAKAAAKGQQGGQLPLDQLGSQGGWNFREGDMGGGQEGVQSPATAR